MLFLVRFPQKKSLVVQDRLASRVREVYKWDYNLANIVIGIYSKTACDDHEHMRETTLITETSHTWQTHGVLLDVASPPRGVLHASVCMRRRHAWTLAGGDEVMFKKPCSVMSKCYKLSIVCRAIHHLTSQYSTFVNVQSCAGSPLLPHRLVSL